MKMQQQLDYQGITYDIIAMEHEFIIHPTAFGFLPINKTSLQRLFSSSYETSNYKLHLNNITIFDENTHEVNDMNNEEPKIIYQFEHQPVSYHGAILIGNTPLKEYFENDSPVGVYAYKNVYELIFEDGILVTTVDQRKAMQRIRKNIEMGLRSLTNKKDIRCIKRFINASFVGDYKPFSSDKKRMKYLTEMKKEYYNKTVVSFLQKN